MTIVPGRTLEVPDGRVVRTLEAGPPDGTPVVVFHPTPSSRLFVRQHADVALRTGVRLVGFSRPGSGGSTMAAPGLRVVAEDAARVADAAGLDRFAVLGFSGGTPFAAATAALFPDRVRAIGLCAVVAPLPLDERDEVETEKRHLRDLLALDDDALASALLAGASGADARFLDRRLAASQGVTLRDALEDDDGTPTFLTLDFDHAAFSPPWDVDVTAVAAPTWVWQGTDDQVTPVRARRVVRRVPPDGDPGAASRARPPRVVRGSPRRDAGDAAGRDASEFTTSVVKLVLPYRNYDGPAGQTTWAISNRDDEAPNRETRRTAERERSRDEGTPTQAPRR